MEPTVRGAWTQSGIAAAPAQRSRIAAAQNPEYGFNCRDESTTSAVRLEDCGDLTRLVAEIVVHKDELVVRLKSDNTDEASDCPDDRSLSIPWQKPPSKRSRQILLPHNASRSDVRPEQFERRARLVSAIARGRRWLDDVVSGRVTTVAQLCAREKRQRSAGQYDHLARLPRTQSCWGSGRRPPAARHRHREAPRCANCPREH